MQRASFRPVAIGLLLLGLALTAAGADVMSLKGCDEGFYAQIAREMASKREYGTLTFLGVPNFEKPPLLIWLMVLTFKVLGASALAARLPIMAMGAVLPVLVAWGLWRRGRSRSAAAIAGAVVATTGLYLQLSHQVMMDVPALCGVAAMLIGLLESEESPRAAWVFALGLGSLVLMKGALGVLILLTMLPYAAWKARSRLVRLAGTSLVALLPALGWYGVMTARHGGAFWAVHLGQQIVMRAEGTLHRPDPTGPAFYLLHGLADFLPWSLMVPAAIACAWRRARRGDGLSLLSLSQGAAFLLAISCMQSKFDHYALPLLVPVAWAIADWWSELRAGPMGRWIIATAALYAMLGLGLATALAFLPPVGRGIAVPGVDPTTLAWLWGGIAALSGMAVGVAVVLASDRRWFAVPGLAGGMAALVSVLAIAVHPWDAEPAFRQIAERLPAGAPVNLVLPGNFGDQFCTFAALRFAVPGPVTEVEEGRWSSLPAGWYVTHLPTSAMRPGDAVRLESGAWRLVERSR